MDEFGSQLGRFTTTARLFGLVEQLPKEHQLILLKQLLGERITQHLYKLVIEMPESQRQRLLEQLAEFPLEPTEVTTVNLDEEDTPMRQIQRKACRLRAVCVVDASTFETKIAVSSVAGGLCAGGALCSMVGMPPPPLSMLSTVSGLMPRK